MEVRIERVTEIISLTGQSLVNDLFIKDCMIQT